MIPRGPAGCQPQSLLCTWMPYFPGFQRVGCRESASGDASQAEHRGSPHESAYQALVIPWRGGHFLGRVLLGPTRRPGGRGRCRGRPPRPWESAGSAAVAPPVAYNGGVELASRCLPLPADDRSDPADIECADRGRPRRPPVPGGSGGSRPPTSPLTGGRPHLRIGRIRRSRRRFGGRQGRSTRAGDHDGNDDAPGDGRCPVRGRPPGGATGGRARSGAASSPPSAAGPGRLFRVAVVPLWGDHYRVNVMTGDDPTAVRIPHSYFVAADGQGNILASTPAIRNEYV